MTSESSNEAIIADLQQRAVEVITALNSRDLDHASTIWKSNVAEDFNMTIGDSGLFPHLPESLTTNLTSATSPKAKLNREQNLAIIRGLVETYPDCHIRVLDMCTNVAANRTAKMFMTATLEGVPKGVSREMLSVMDWEWRDGGWVAVRNRHLSGMGAL